MENKNYTTRIDRKKMENEIKSMQEEKEKELEKRREEMKKILFDDNKKKKTKKPIITNIILSLTLTTTLIIFVFIILNSTNHVNQIYEIINAFFLLSIVISLLISFKKAFFKNSSISMSISAILILIAFIFNSLYFGKIIKLPTQNHIINFENKNLTKAINWAEKNNIKNTETFEYSDQIKKYNIINQSEKENTLTKNIKNVNFTISNGPDYNKEVILPDMTGQSVSSITKFVNKNFLKNVQVNFEENSNINKNSIIKQSTTGKIKRNDAVIFTVSLGNKESLKPIKLKNLASTSLLDSTIYLGKNGINFELKYEFSNKIEKGKIISSNIKPGNTIKPNDKIILTISKGKKVIIPNFTNKSLSYITKWMVMNNVQINYLEEYSDIKQGNATKCNYKKGDVIEEETTIDITFSKGKLIMKSFNNLAEFKAWADSNNVKYEIKEEFNDEIAKDNIIKTSITLGQQIKQNDTIIIYVSKGKAIEVPDFSGKTKQDVLKECKNLGLSCSFTEQYSKNIDSDKVISQSIPKGSKIAAFENINIVIATKDNKKTVSAKIQKKTSYNTISNNQNTNNQSANNQCTEETIYLTPDLITNSSSDTCSKINKKYGNYLICSQEDSDEGKSGQVLNATNINGKTVSSCNKMTVKIKK